MRGSPIITSFLAGETSPLTAGRVDLDGYNQSCELLQNMIVRIHGPAEKRPGTRFIAAVGDSTKLVRLIEFAYSAADNYILELGDYYMRFFTAGGQVMDGSVPYEITTPWASEDLDLIKFVQSADVMYFVHPAYPVQKLIRNDVDDWEIDEVEFTWGPFITINKDQTLTVTPSAVTGTGITLTASSALFKSTHVGAFWKITNDKITSGNMAALDATTTPVLVNAAETIICSLSGTWVGTVKLQRSYDGGATWLDYLSYTLNTSFEVTALEATEFRWKFTTYTSGTATGQMTQRDLSGYVKITAFTSTTVVTADVIEDLSSTAATSLWSEGAFSEEQGYPSAIAFYEQRLMLAGTLFVPSGIWASYVDDYEYFETGPTEAHAYHYVLAGAKVNQIVWMTPLKILQAGTIGDEWRFGFNEVATTAQNVSAKKESEHGSAPLQPMVIEGSPVILETGGRALRSIVYSLDEDTYRAPRISEHAEHLLRSGLVAMTYVQQPTPTIWAVNNLGQVISCTFSRIGKIAAYSRHEFTGIVESIASMRAADRDEVWMVVYREIDGSPVRYVERMEPGEWENVEDAFYVDSGLSYDGAPGTVFGGLDHLEGETVSILADGAVHAPVEVVGGEITLTTAASVVHAGLPYTAILRTRKLDPKTASGSSQGKPKQIFKCYVRFDRSLNCSVGYDETHLHPMIFRETEVPLGSPPEPFTGDREINMYDCGTDDARIVVLNSDPVPFTIVSISATMHASEL